MAENIKRPDGTFLIPLPGASNTHTDHYHVGPDGTILSIVEDGAHKHKASDLRQKISAVTGMSFPPTDYRNE
jgi:hypothetical protein